MDELEILKKNWSKTTGFEQVSESAIYKILLKKSSSVVKWIFIVSVLEFSFGILLGVLLSFTKYDLESTKILEKWGVYSLYLLTSVFLYIVILFFIYRFYMMYKKISVTDNVKQLLSSIIKTRNVVKQYIAFNLITFAVFFVSFLGYGLYFEFIERAAKQGDLHPTISTKVWLVSSVLVLVVTLIFVVILWLIYKLLYGILLTKLQKNYQELKKIELD